MSKRLPVVLGAAFCLIFVASSFVWALDVKESLSKADGLYEQRGQDQNAQKAATIYETILKQDPKNQEAAWKMARALFWVGGHSPKEKKLEIFDKAVKAAKQAIAIDPKSVEGHFWLGANYGFYGSAKGVMESLSLIDPIKEQMAEVRKLDSDYGFGGPDRVEGRLFFKVPGLFGGDNDKAMELLEKAVKIGPNYFLNHIYLAEVYLDEDKKEEAKKLLLKVLAGPCVKGMEPEYVDWKKTAQKMLEQI